MFPKRNAGKITDHTPHAKNAERVLLVLLI
jgi:hypothetical protein